MINNIYSYNGQDFALGGAINGELNGMIITSRGDSDVYVITLANNAKVALSDKYAVAIEAEGKDLFVCSSNVTNANKVKLVNGSLVQVVSVEKRKGKDINVPKDVFGLNGILVSRNFVSKEPVWNNISKPSSNVLPPVPSGVQRR